MNNTDKLLSDAADTVVLSYLRAGISIDDFFDHLKDGEIFSIQERNAIQDKAVGVLSALAEFFERTIRED